ncbi:MAG TPA: asparagine synthase (glutamine-hydrolyzing) [Bryobacteraceae bacterium]|nr:asparagine synthase (glutamine-hydrolyzing) [Bryobacteraceae bacterium]
MCGIAGIVGETDSLRANAIVQAMVTSLARRGPDAEGIECWPDAVLGHRRLSIFDLSAAGSQPMVSGDRSVGVVFNGAIYNFRPLREELERGGYRFRSQTDTEVLIHGYLHWGMDELLRRMRGMFAIALWDSRHKKLFLLRDRLGVKPLVYTVQGRVISFASTVRALRDGGVAGSLDEQGIAEFLEFGYVTADRSIYRNVSKAPPGCLLEWSGGQLRKRDYWTPRPVRSNGVSFEQAVEETEAHFLEAVKLRLEADVPVGALLSGGVDSSLVCWAIAKLGAGITAFTIGTPGDPGDETADAIETAKALGIRHEAIPVSAGDAPDVEELIAAYGEPFACASALGMLRVSRAVRAEATVLLTGDGGDDVFLGYPEHGNFYRAQQVARLLPPGSLPLWKMARPLLPKAGWMRRGTHFLDYATGGLGAVAQAHDGLPMYHRQRLLGERLRNATVSQRSIPWSRESATHLMSEFLNYDRHTRFTGEYLTKVDGGAMHYAVEARSPFLDHELWDYASSLPFALRLRGGTLKAVLREIARRRVSRKVAEGVKRGFGIPVGRWLAGKWGERFQESFQHSLLAEEGFIDAKNVLALWRRTASQGLVPNQLWYLFVLETWLRFEKSRGTGALIPTLPAIQQRLR